MKTIGVAGNFRCYYLLVLFLGLAIACANGQGITRRSFTVEQGGTLRIVLGAGNVHVSTWSNNEVRVNSIEDEDGVDVSKNGNTIVVRSSGDVDIDVSIPSRFNVDLQCGSGDIRIDGPLSGRVRGRTSGGEVTLGKLHGDISLSTSGGDIACDNIGGTVALQSAGGNLQLEDIDGDATLQTDGGNIDVKNVRKSITASTSGGNVSVGTVGGNARLSTSGGDLEVGSVSGDCELESSGGNILVHGCGGKVSATTEGGDVTLDRVAGAFDGSTSAGNINVQMMSAGKAKRGTSRLTNDEGNITLEIPADVSATIVARIRFHDRWQNVEDGASITSDFPTATFHKDEASGEIIETFRLNDGTGKITLDASMGSITIHKENH